MRSIALCLAALIAAFTLAVAQDTGVDRNTLAQEMNAMTSNDWRQGVPFGNKLATLPGSAGFEILRDNWSKGASVEARKQMFKGFVFNDHPDTLKVLNLGATDPSVEMQNWSFAYLKDIAFIDFTEDYKAYAPWFAKYGNGKLDEVRSDNFKRFMASVAASSGEERELYYRKLSLPMLGRKPLRSPDALKVVKEIYMSPNPSQEAARAAGELLRIGQPDEAFLRTVVLPGLNSKSLELRYATARALATVKGDWVDDALVALLKASVEKPGGLKENGFMIGDAFGERKDPKHIPLLIGAIAADNGYDSVYGIGYFGLSKITGVSYDKTHDGQWWINWWANNKDRFPENVRNLAIPKFGPPPHG